MTKIPSDTFENGFENGLCLVVEDLADCRVYLEKTLNTAFPQLKVHACGDIKSARHFLEKNRSADTCQKIVLSLIDLGLPDGSGTELIRYLARTEPDSRNVVVTVYDDDAHLFEALTAGANGYLLKYEEPSHFAEILTRIMRDEPPLSPSIAQRVLQYFFRPPAEASAANPLTPRESETLVFLSRGLTVGECAKEMGLSPSTVAGYVKIIYQKLRVSNRAGATREAIKLGLV